MFKNYVLPKSYTRPGPWRAPTANITFFSLASYLLPTDVQHCEDGKYIPMYRLKWTCYALHNLEIQKTNFLV